MPPRTLLVVTEDEAISQAARFGFPSDTQVVVMPDAGAASEWMKHSIPAAVVAEIRTGNEGGFALGKDMRADERLARVPLVMIVERMQDLWLARQAGADLCLRKPLGMGDLVARTLEVAESGAK
ncbi:MAG: hypothetical protein ABR575_11315 [Actinomycetota bacterium]